MQYQLLGNSGLRVAELCLGTMTFGDTWGWGADKTESRKMYDLYREAGGNFVDTANFYTGGASEQFLGEFIQGHRQEVVLATKYTDSVPGKDPNAGGNQRKNLVQSLEASLKRLRTDYVDLYWVHAWDFFTPVEEIMRGLDDLVRQGKILYVGVSDAPAWAVSEANMLAGLRGWTPFVGLQLEYNLIQRTGERELIPMAKARNLSVLAWSPLASGLLTGKYSQKQPVYTDGDSKRIDKTKAVALSERNLSIADAVTELAGEIGRKPSQVALAWLRQKGTIPLLGGTKASQIGDNLESLQVTLSPQQIQHLDEISRVPLDFPHEFLAATRGYTYGGQYDNIQTPKKQILA